MIWDRRKSREAAGADRLRLIGTDVGEERLHTVTKNGVTVYTTVGLYGDVCASQKCWMIEPCLRKACMDKELCATEIGVMSDRTQQMNVPALPRNSNLFAC